MDPDPNDPHIVLQAHKLRSALAADSLVHGSAGPRARPRTVAVVVWSVVIAALILAAILLTGVIIDYLAARQGR